MPLLANEPASARLCSRLRTLAIVVQRKAIRSPLSRGRQKSVIRLRNAMVVFVLGCLLARVRTASSLCHSPRLRDVWKVLLIPIYTGVAYALATLFLPIAPTSHASPEPFPVVVKGRVVDDAASKPIEDAVVLAHWTRYVSGFHGGVHYCFHVESTRSKSDGSFEIRATLPPLRGVSAKLEPAVVVYKPGYQTSLKRMRVHPDNKESVVRMSIFWEPIERMPLDKKEPIRYLVPSTLDRTDRLRYLNTIARAASCGSAEDSEKNGLELLHALRNEASASAVTNYEQYLVRRIEYRIQLAKGNKNGHRPERPKPSVVEAVKSRDASRLEQALRAPGSDPNERDDDDMTALMIASRFGSPELVRILLEAGSDPNKIEWGEGSTALHQATSGAMSAKNVPDRYSHFMATIQTLLASKTLCADITNIFGKTPLDFAIGKEYVGSPLHPDIVALIRARQSPTDCRQ